ncbi:uncharacterized protein LOC129942363 [Eupeodes corollae]|uniref:uncharacterized protein LOC129942363 n=1 Tax=Eupeodes corollae TaxID=290404 RepID=UPI00248FB8E0|nr:uncharacterized protein LOC129942363 [Eupeodes corollae]
MFSKNTIITFIFLIVIFKYSEPSGTPVRRCSRNYPFPLHVQIEDCKSLPCEVTRGTLAQMDMQFVATKDESYNLKASIHATVLGITIPFALSSESADVCKNLLYGAYCPLYAEEDVTYHIDLPLENNIPEVNVRCEVKILDSKKDVVSCFIADLKVRKA